MENCHKKLGYTATDLEVIGSITRRSNTEIYEGVTAITIATVTSLIAESSRDAALGALRLWSDLAGHLAKDEDRLRLHQLIDRVPTNN